MEFEKAISKQTKENWEKLLKEKKPEYEDLDEMKEIMEENRDIRK